MLDGKSGEFVYEGNVYRDEELAPTATKFPAKSASGKDELFIIKSYHAKSTEQRAGVER